jgi:hypothetical protein
MTITPIVNLAAVAEAQDQPGRAAELLLRLARAQRELAGVHDERTIESAFKAARFLVSAGRFSEAESLLLDLHDQLAATHGPEHRMTALTMRALAGLYRSAGEAEKSEQWLARYSLISPPLAPSTQRSGAARGAP